MTRGRERYDSEDRKSIGIYPDTWERIRQHKQPGESVDATLRRVVPDPEPDLWACDDCGAALLDPAVNDGDETLCGRCADGKGGDDGGPVS